MCVCVRTHVRTHSHPNTYASGPDKLSPQHIKELISHQTGAAGSRLLQALTTMANVILSGDVPSQVCPIFFGAYLIALRKPDGGVRPIAIGDTLRRMVAKAVSRLMFDTFGNKLRPVQLGCGTKAGCEAAVHAARTYLTNASESKPRILLKMDFRNAFNTLRRDKLLTVIREQFPHLHKFIWQAYSAPSTLFFGRYTRLSHWSATRGPFRSCFVQLSHPVSSNNPFFGIQHLVFGRWHNWRRNKPSTL